jgi:Phage tail assembly chaperone proteins, E, or 41 or 14
MNEIAKGAEFQDPTAAGAPDDGSVTVTLRSPIQVYGENKKELTFRKPTVADLLFIGVCPVTLDTISSPPRFLFDEEAAMTAMMARLAVAPSSSIDRLWTEDSAACERALLPFFSPEGMEMTIAKKPPDGDGSISVKLNRAVFDEKSGAQVELIKFRQPMRGDITRLGEGPVRFNEFGTPPTIKHNVGRMHVVLQRLSGLPAAFFESLTVPEWLGLAWGITRFFLNLQENPST